MNILMKARRSLADVLKRQEEILTALVNEGRAATDAEKTEQEKLSADKAKWEGIIEQCDELRKNKNAHDPGSAGESVGSSGSPSIRVIREDGENEQGEYTPFRSIGEQLMAVVNAAREPHKTDKRLLEINNRAAAGANESLGSDGGFLVQTTFATELIKKTFDTGVIASKCSRIPLSNSNAISFPTVEDYSRANGSRWGGIQVYWENEADAATATKPKFGTMDMKLKKLLGLFYATDELLSDTAALGSFVNQAFPEEFAFRVDDAILRGTGAGQPKGVLNSDCLITVSAVASQGASTIVGQNVLDMRARLWARSRPTSEWFINQDCESQIHTLSIVKSKSDVPLYNPANGMNQPLDTILARPVNVIEQCESVGTVGDIILADFKQYLLIEREGVQAAQSIHVKFTTEETAFRWSMRLDGQPMWKKALTPYKGSNTQSPFIVLSSSRT